jgi:hypothetical protein
VSFPTGTACLKPSGLAFFGLLYWEATRQGQRYLAREYVDTEWVQMKETFLKQVLAEQTPEPIT